MVCFGAGIAALATVRALGRRPSLVVDGTEALWGKTLLGAPIDTPDSLSEMQLAGRAPYVVICAYGGASVARIVATLRQLGLEEERDFCDCSDILVGSISETLVRELGHRGELESSRALRDYMLKCGIDNQSSVAGTWLMIELLKYLMAEGIAGDVAEAGVFRGGNAQMVLESLDSLLGERGYHLFDSFAGLPEVGTQDPASRAGEFANVSLEEIRDVFSPFNRVQLHVGWFAETFPQCRDKRFALAYVDCDLYQPTVECCEFFYSRLVAGGVLLFHDYWVEDEELPVGGREPFTGVRRAVDEFAMRSDARVVRFPETTHAMIVRER